MKIRKIIPQMSYAIKPNRIDATSRQSNKRFFPTIGVAFAISVSLSVVTNPVRAEANGTEDIQHYMDSQTVEKTVGRASQNPKESAAATDVRSKKTNQGEHGTNSSAVGTDGKAKQAAKETATEKCADGKNAASSSQMTASEEKQSSAVLGDQTANTNQNAQPTTLAKDVKPENSPLGDKTTQDGQKMEPVSKPADGKGKLPTFAQADVNGDHYITKDELQNFPYLLQVFDKIDAGKDGKLEQHEYQSLKMETKREGEVS
jgi:hypothetical protein